MTTFKLGLLLGDGIGPEIVPGAAKAMDRAVAGVGLGIEWIELPMGWAAIEQHGDPMPQSTKEALAQCEGWLMGPHDAASYPREWKERADTRPPAGEVRHHFDLYANIRPSRTFAGVSSVVDAADLVIVRENTEGFLSDRNMVVGSGEFSPAPGVALCVGVFKDSAVERVIRRGFELAARRRKRVTVVHKAGPLPLTLGLYKRIVYEVAEDYPDVEPGDIHVDSVTAALVRRPQDFDVIVAENLLGDILSDLAAELVGSPGLASSLNAGDEHAMAAAAHGSAPDIAGQGIANPLGVVLAGALLLGWLAETRREPRAARAQQRIEHAVERTLTSGVLTPDMGGQASTEEVLAEVLAHIEEPNQRQNRQSVRRPQETEATCEHS